MPPNSERSERHYNQDIIINVLPMPPQPVKSADMYVIPCEVFL